MEVFVETKCRIVCACCIQVDGIEEILVVRSDGTVELSDSPIFVEENDVIGVCSFKEGDKFALIDTTETISIYKIALPSRTCECIAKFFQSHSCSLTRPVGVSYGGFNVEIFFSTKLNSFVFRTDHEEHDMSSDLRGHRRYLPAVILNCATHERRDVLVPGIHLSICLYEDNLAILSRRYSTDQTHTAIHFVVLLEQMKEIRVPPELGENVSRISSQESKLVVVFSQIGMALYRNENLQNIFFYSTSFEIVPLRFHPHPKLHPALSLFRKYSQVETAPLLEESLLNLSLGANISAVPDRRRGALVLVAPQDDVPCHVWGKGMIFLIVDRFLHVLEVTETEFKSRNVLVPAEGIDFLFLKGDDDLYGIAGNEIHRVMHHQVESSSSSNEMVVMAKQVESLAVFGDESNITISLDENRLKFSAKFSIKCNLVFSNPMGHNVTEIFSISPDHIAICFPNQTRILRITSTQSSPLSSLVSLESDSSPASPLITFQLSETASPPIRADLESLRLVFVEKTNEILQVTSQGIFLNGVETLSRRQSTVIAYSILNNSVYLLFSDGYVIGPGIEIDTEIIDPVCIAIPSEEEIVVGTFDGYIHRIFFTLRKGKKISSVNRILISSSPIDSIHICSSKRLFVATRSDGIFLFSNRDDKGLEVLRKLNGHSQSFKLCMLKPDLFACFGYSLILIDVNSSESRSIMLGHKGLIASVAARSENCLIILLEGNLVEIQLDVSSKVAATYEKVLPVTASSMIVAPQSKHLSDIYMLGSLRSSNHPHTAALLTLVLEQVRIGLTGMNEALSISAVLPFTHEQPISMCLWQHEMFPETGLVAVGTRGRVRGRLIVFERHSMNALAKTSVPSQCVFSLCPLCPNVIALGCEDCVALLSLKAGPRSMPLILSTVGVFNTYSAVKFLTKVDESSLLAVTDNGCVQLIRWKGDFCSSEASPETAVRVVSACFLMPNSNLFVCSSFANDLLVFRLDPDSLTLVQTLKLGALVTSGCQNGNTLSLGLDNGSIIHLTHTPDQVRVVNQSS